MKFGSLFAGIGGIDLGLERAGMSCSWQVEIDDYARRVLAKHWPNVPRYRDITEVDGRSLPPVDLIAAGFPCQDISYAGRGAGLEGERSGLFFETVRMVRQCQPRYVLLENVAALLTRGLDRVLGTLAEIGYDAEWHCIPAAAVGAPHIRDRVFVIAHAKGQRCGTGRTGRTSGIGAGEEDAKDVADAENRDPPVSHDIRPGQMQLGGSGGSECAGWWSTEPDVGRVAHGVPNRVDRLRGLGNAVVPQVAEFLGRHIMDLDTAAHKSQSSD